MKVTAKITAFGFEQTKVNPKQLEQAVQKAVEEIGQKIAVASEIRRREFEQLKREAQHLLMPLEKVIDKKVNISVDVVRAQPPFVLGPSSPSPTPSSIPARGSRVAPPPPPSPTPGAEKSQLGKALRLILIALAQHGECSKRKTALLSGYALGGGGFNNALAEANSKGYIERRGENLTITQAGVDALETVPPLPAGDELLNHWRSQFSKAEREIFDVLYQNQNGPMTDEDIAAKTASGYVAGTGGFSNALSRLRTLEIVEGSGRTGGIKLSAEFLEAVQ